MGFVDQNGYPLINEEKKVRITLSTRARIIMTEDMNIFNVKKEATFINTVFDHFKADATSSVSLYLQQKELELNQLLNHTELTAENKKTVKELLLKDEKQKIQNKNKEYITSKGESKLYHINAENVSYLLNDCHEEEYYPRPGLYLRSIIEEYCSLPFIRREEIYRQDIYNIVQQACREKRMLKVTAKYNNKDQLFYAYPYKIMADSSHTQSYLVCYSRKAEEEEDAKIIASFSMARMKLPTLLKKSFHLTKQEVDALNARLARHSAAYLLGKPERIEVELTEKGEELYRTRLFSRPEKIDASSSDHRYTFVCPQRQAYNYFFPFGDNATIISPKELKKYFKDTLDKASQLYKNDKTSLNCPPAE